MAEKKHIVLVGSGGCMRELVWQIQEYNQSAGEKMPEWYIDGYVDVSAPQEGMGCFVGNQCIPYLGTDEYFLSTEEPVNVVVCVGNPFLRRKIVENLKQNPNICFPNLILGETGICKDAEMGEGCIISMDCRISTNVKLGNFVFLNTGSKVCHDCRLGDFATLSPDVTLAGNVSVGSLCEIGLGAKVIQGISIGKQTIVGAGGVVIRNISAECTAVGVPAKVIQEKNEIS